MTLIEKAAETDSCPVCSNHDRRTIYKKARDPITGDCFQVVECSECGMVRTTPVPDCLDRYYPPRYRGYGPIVARVLSTLYKLRVSRWARRKPGGGSVLEIGCGSGLMLAAFRQCGWRVLGLERNEAVAEIGRRSLGVEIVSSPVEALPHDAQFDLIIMFQVLEHIADPIGLLRACVKRLAPGGFLITNVPNFSSWQSKFAGAKWFHLDVPRHLNHFTPQTLDATLNRAGLSLTHLSFASLEHDPYGWVESTLNGLTRRANTLTRFLMGLDPLGPAVLFTFALGALLIPAAGLLSMVSWMAGRGALMEASAVVSVPARK
jgi:SAM-dependent methyltransferase